MQCKRRSAIAPHVFAQVRSMKFSVKNEQNEARQIQEHTVS